MQKPLALSQHSLPRPEHRAGESREPPQLQFQLCLPRLRQRGGSCGPGPRLAHTRCLISPLWPGIRPPPASLPGLSATPMGEGRVQGPTCSTFSILELYYIKSLLLIWFFTAGTLIAFFHSFLPILEAGVSRVVPLEHENPGAALTAGIQPQSASSNFTSASQSALVDTATRGSPRQPTRFERKKNTFIGQRANVQRGPLAPSSRFRAPPTLPQRLW